jgi:hypothetical protein
MFIMLTKCLVTMQSHLPLTVSHFSFILSITKGKGQGKAIPLQPLTGPEGSRGLRLPDFKTIGT